jgi:hypothetical protein
MTRKKRLLLRKLDEPSTVDLQDATWAKAQIASDLHLADLKRERAAGSPTFVDLAQQRDRKSFHGAQ